jgi:adenylosuccinate lyase
MIQRYSLPEMRKIWSEERKLEIWLQIEILTAEALCRQGVIPENEFNQLKSNAKFDISRCHELEKTINHDVVAFTTNVSENIGAPANRWLHYGLTSSDLLDTTLAIQMIESADILIKDVKELRSVIADKAIKYKFTPMIGRSHGVHAEPITFGLKMALMYDEFGRALQRLLKTKESVAVGKISGAVGTHAHLSPSVEAYVCSKLGLRPAVIATQVIQRDLHAEFILTLALIAASIERWAVEFRHLQRTEVLEVEEFFGKGQKGSSAMPHKRNPITSERLTGLARVIRGNAIAALENVALWHERDISHSSVERVIFPDSCTLLDYMLVTLKRLIEGLLVYPDNMLRNMDLSLGLWHSQAVLLALLKKGFSREQAYEMVQRNAMKTWQAKHENRNDADFKTQLLKDEDIGKILTKEELDSICRLEMHFKDIDRKFKELGLE